MIKLVLSQFEYAKPRLQEAEMVNLLLSKRDSDRKVYTRINPKSGPVLTLDKKKKPSRSITLLALRILKRIYK